MLRDQFARWGLQSTFVDMTDPGAVKRALTASTRLIWIESPSNPRLHVTDIVAMVALAKTIGARTVVDNTWATPVLQRPLELGVDLVMHSTTKYLGGHSDVLGGAIVARSLDSTFERIRAIQGTLGAVASPFDCWLVLRGMRSLPYRMRGHVDGAEALAAFLAASPKVARVYYPGLASDPGHAVASRQMRRPGGMLSFDVHGGRPEAFAMVNRLKLVTRATSLGGPETLIEHRASVEGEFTRAPESLLRVSVGLEHPDDIIEDFAQALGH
jgi:cystathionine gamma-synthase